MERDVQGSGMWIFRRVGCVVVQVAVYLIVGMCVSVVSAMACASARMFSMTCSAALAFFGLLTLPRVVRSLKSG
jgi:hypothetical protein